MNFGNPLFRLSVACRPRRYVDVVVIEPFRGVQQGPLRVFTSAGCTWSPDLGGTNETCTNGACVSTCVSNDHTECYSGDVYWYNSCGVRGTISDSCASDEICVEDGSSASCESSCTETDYWSPTSDVDIDYTAQDTGGVEYTLPLSVELVQDGSGLEFRVCKEDDSNFSENIYINMWDLSGGPAYREIALSTKGYNCSSWVGLLSDTGYAEGDYFYGAYYIVSPSSSASSFKKYCAANGSTGLCWYGALDSFDRTCR